MQLSNHDLSQLDVEELLKQTEQSETDEQRKPGKQPGAKGFGRQQTLPITDYQEHLPDLCACCHHPLNAENKKTYALATEMLNDWKAIFRVLEYPHLPLTNNEAERALRHWVILRRISYGTRTENGSRVFAILISVIETCRKRQQSPWLYLATVIHNQRSGGAVPKLPISKDSE